MFTDIIREQLRMLGATHYTTAHNFTGSNCISSYHFFKGETTQEVAYYMPSMHFAKIPLSGFKAVIRENPQDAHGHIPLVFKE